MAADRWIDVLAAGTGFAGALLAWWAWRRVLRTVARDRRRHPATASPISLAITSTSSGPRWQVAVTPGWPPTTLDILTFREQGASTTWSSEPIVDPLPLDPDLPTTLDAEVPDPAATYDVVLAWTTEGPNGPAPGSQTLTVPDAAAVRAPGASSAAFRWAYPVVGVLLAGAGLVGLFGAIDAEADDADARPAATTTLTTAPTDGSNPGGTDAAPSTAPGTPPQDSAPAGSSPATTAPPTTTTTSTTEPRTGPRVEIEGRVEDCRFGAECVIVGFRVVEFEGSGEYVCEFDDGSRFVFRYGGDGADDACARSGPNPSVVVEVDGIRSLTATQRDPNGR